MTVWVIGVLIVSCVLPVTNVAGAWTSPGASQTYTLSWLEQNTDSVTEPGDPGYFYLVDDVTISETDTLNFAAGEYLYIYPDTKLYIKGNFNINGVQANPVHISMSNSIRSTSVNFDWEYDSVNVNGFTINYLDADDILMEFTDDQGTTLRFESDWITYDDPGTTVQGSWELTNLVPDPAEVYAIRLKGSLFGGDNPNMLSMFDADGDEMPDYWEVANGLNMNSAADKHTDADNDGLDNFEEYTFRTNPQLADTDTDGLEDGDEVHGCGGINDYTSNPKKIHTDVDTINDWDEIDDQVSDSYETNPSNRDTDGDTLDDDDEQDDGLDPTDTDTDDDDFQDNRDVDPLKVNRKFAFVAEVNDYWNLFPSPISIDRKKDSWEVANIFASWDFDTFFYTDYDYNSDGDQDNNVVGAVLVKYDVMKWDSFTNAWNNFVNTRVGAQPGGNGNDVICLYIDAWGKTTGGAYTMYFPTVNGQNQIIGNGPRTELQLQNELDALGTRKDFIWIQTPNCDGWEPEIATNEPPTGDKLDAGQRVVVLSDDDINDNHNVFKAFRDEYNDEPDDGVETTFEAITSKDNHYKKDRYTTGDGNLYLN
jgi:hypothetical protein